MIRSLRHLRLTLLAGTIVAGAAGGAQAQSVWQGGAQNNQYNWDLASNWSTGAIPTSSSLVEFAAPYTTYLPVALNGPTPAQALSSTLTGSLIDLKGWTLTLSGTNSSAQSFSGNIGNSSTTQAGITFGGAGFGTQSLSGVISGATLVTVDGGFLNLAAANSYSAGTTVSGGTLNAQTAKALGSGPLTINSGTVNVAGDETVSSLAQYGGALNINSGNFIATNGATTNGGATSVSGTLTLGSASSLGTVLLQSGGKIALTGALTVTTDFANANAGVGNAYKPLANVTGGAVDAPTGTTMAIAPLTVALGAVHVGATKSATFQVHNTTTAAVGTTLRGAVQTTGLTDASLSLKDSGGNTITGGGDNFGPIVAAASSGSYTVAWAPTTGGALSGQSIQAVSDFSNVASATAAVTGTAWNLAQASILSPSGASIALGAVHVGDVDSQTLSIENVGGASQNYAYTEGLDARALGPTGSATVSGSINNLAAGSQSSAIALGLSTATAGAIAGSASVRFLSDGATTSHLSTTTLNSTTFSLSGNVYGYATPGALPGAIAPVVAHVGDSASKFLTISNTAPTGGYYEGLDASFGATTGAAVANGGSVTNVAAGSNDGGANLAVGVDTRTAGAKTGTVTVNFASDGATTSGLGTTALTSASQTVSVSGDVYHYADPVLQKAGGDGSLVETDATHYTLDFGTVGKGGSASLSLAILNQLYGDDPTGAFTDSLGGAFGPASSALAPFSYDFATFDLAAGQQAIGTIRFDASGGPNTVFETLTFSPTSTDIGGTSDLTPITITLEGTVAAAAPEPSTWAMLGLGFAGLGLAGRRRMRAPKTA
ncbi:putative secreted protein with PEP-CTERM sorting signal [Roseiarcus fermentans]|uniref:Putative secreted protein with PEP-CTERM sorting signal n=1 Tax=Roseiarcus fermentans TaxID=1473586 RepID=A0A366F4E1_9HYPH|nr:choice-of-anchor D domain-containing protein [Roseiarcus fermentans]RBP08575.1 putative secreted protein with PEP-CTERM sorting signal [Roseiarcus fermentans]